LSLSWLFFRNSLTRSRRLQYIAALPNPPENVYFKALDFFNFDLPEDGKKFNLAYDYTFLCALPPSMREAWGKRYAKIIAPEGQCHPDLANKIVDIALYHHRPSGCPRLPHRWG
jgi:hypothetical protein